LKLNRTRRYKKFYIFISLFLYNFIKGTSISKGTRTSFGINAIALSLIGVLLPSTLFVVEPHNDSSHHSKYKSQYRKQSFHCVPFLLSLPYLCKNIQLFKPYPTQRKKNTTPYKPKRVRIIITYDF